MESLYIAIVLLCRVAQHLCTKPTSDSVKTAHCFLKFSAYRNAVSALLAGILLIGGTFHLDAYSLLLSLAAGAAITLSCGLSLAALKSGTVALSTMFGTAGLIIPCAAGALFFDEPFSAWQLSGLLLFFVAAYLLTRASATVYGKITPKVLLLVVGIMLAEGATMLVQQVFANTVTEVSVTEFSFLTFLFAALLCLPLALIFKPKSTNFDTANENTASGRLTKKLYIFGAVLAAAVFVINQLVTLAAATVSPILLFTLVNGGSAIIGTLVAAIFFKEKLTPQSIAGTLLGVAALVIIKAF